MDTSAHERTAARACGPVPGDAIGLWLRLALADRFAGALTERLPDDLLRALPVEDG